MDRRRRAGRFVVSVSYRRRRVIRGGKQRGRPQLYGEYITFRGLTYDRVVDGKVVEM